MGHKVDTVNNIDIGVMPLTGTFDVHNTSITLGDLHGHFLKGIYLLKHQGVIDISQANYESLFEISQKSAKDLTQEDLTQLYNDIQSITRATNISDDFLIRFIGDVLADRGPNDWFTLKLLEQFKNLGFKLEILFSNHDHEFVERFKQFKYQKGDFSQVINPWSDNNDKSNSSGNFHTLISKNILERDEVVAVVEKFYLPSVKAISYSLVLNDQGEMTDIRLYTHAPVSFDIIEKLADKYQIPHKIETVVEFIDTIHAINAAFNQQELQSDRESVLASQEDIDAAAPHSGVYEDALGMMSQDPSCQRSSPLFQITTNMQVRFLNMPKECEFTNSETGDKYTVNVRYTFGHIGGPVSQEDKFNHLDDLDAENLAGKNSAVSVASSKAMYLVSDDFPAFRCPHEIYQFRLSQKELESSKNGYLMGGYKSAYSMRDNHWCLEEQLDDCTFEKEFLRTGEIGQGQNEQPIFLNGVSYKILLAQSTGNENIVATAFAELENQFFKDKKEKAHFYKFYSQHLFYLALNSIAEIASTKAEARLSLAFSRNSADEIVAKVVAKNLELHYFKSDGIEKKDFPGAIEVNFMLTGKGFQLQSIQMTNSVLKSVFMGKQIDLSDQLVSQSAAMQEELFAKAVNPQLATETHDFFTASAGLLKATENERYSATPQVALGKVVLNEALALQPKIVAKNDLSFVTNLLKQQVELIQKPEDFAVMKSYHQVAEVVYEKPWGKRLGGAALIGLGILVIAAVVATSVLTFGFGAIALAVGASVLGVGLALGTSGIATGAVLADTARKQTAKIVGIEGAIKLAKLANHPDQLDKLFKKSRVREYAEAHPEALIGLLKGTKDAKPLMNPHDLIELICKKRTFRDRLTGKPDYLSKILANPKLFKELIDTLQNRKDLESLTTLQATGRLEVLSLQQNDKQIFFSEYVAAAKESKNSLIVAEVSDAKISSMDFAHDVIDTISDEGRDIANQDMEEEIINLQQHDLKVSDGTSEQSDETLDTNTNSVMGSYDLSDDDAASIRRLRSSSKLSSHESSGDDSQSNVSNSGNEVLSQTSIDDRNNPTFSDDSDQESVLETSVIFLKH